MQRIEEQFKIKRWPNDLTGLGYTRQGTFEVGESSNPKSDKKQANPKEETNNLGKKLHRSTCHKCGKIGHTTNVYRRKLVLKAYSFSGYFYKYGNFGHQSYEWRSRPSSRSS